MQPWGNLANLYNVPLGTLREPLQFHLEEIAETFTM